MMEMNRIDELFEKARQEKPRLSHQDVSKAFFKSALAVGGFLTLKHLILNKIGLNTIIMISSTSIISIALIIGSLNSGNPEPEPLMTSFSLGDSIENPKEAPQILLEEQTIDIREKEIPLFELQFDSSIEMKTPTLASSDLPKLITNETMDGNVDLIIIENEDNTPDDMKPVSLVGNCSKSFCIKNDDDLSELKCIKNGLEKLDLIVQMDADFTNDDFLKMLKLRIQHENGLDLKIKVAGFTTFALMCIQDKNGEIIALKYKIDEQEFSEINTYSKTSYTYMKSVD